ncbi:MAG: DUF1598 domain-containing protein [Planctomycetales bacterium]|nr:DUF1598 domain-containing protein [Planctomycetales bacterium]
MYHALPIALVRFARRQIVHITTFLAVALLGVGSASAQPLLIPGANNANILPGNNQGANQVNSNRNNGQGGAAQADFDTLIELIQDTIAPDSWSDIGGDGSIQGFPGGVYVDATGVMKRIDPNTRSLLAKRFRTVQSTDFADEATLNERSELRKVSLRQLELAIQERALHEQPPTDAMKYLAGLERIDYVVIDQANNDIVLAGPADKWTRSDDGRVVSKSTRRPLLQLDDLVVLLRNAMQSHGQFTCSITPTQNGLAQFRAYAERTTQKPLKAGTRMNWVNGLQESLGNQLIEVQGLSAETRVGRVIVEADYHMKLIGIGLEPATDGVVSYLDSIEIAKGQSPPAMSVLRWWFTLKNNEFKTSADGSTIDLQAQNVQLLSENQLLTKLGKRVRTGQSDRLNREFASSFTRHFDAIAKRYPVYADLENVFELAIVASLARTACQNGDVAWRMPFLIDADKYKIATARVAREVPSIVNHRLINNKHVVCAVSGGVSFRERISTSTSTVEPLATRSFATAEGSATWWWD